MSDDPVRWKDAEDAPAKVRDLLARGRATPPMPDHVRAALLAALPVAAPPPSPPAPPAPPAAGAAAASAGVPAAWLIGGVAVVAVAALAWNARAPENSAKQGAPSATPVVVVGPSRAAASVAPTPSEVALPVVSAFPEAPLRPSPRQKPSAAPSTPAPLANAVAESNLAEESTLVARARANLAPSPAASLDAVEEHARRYPRGELAAEREYLRVSALRRLGRNDEARTRGQRYLTAFPASPYTSAVRTILTELGEP